MKFPHKSMSCNEAYNNCSAPLEVKEYQNDVLFLKYALLRCASNYQTNICTKLLYNCILHLHFLFCAESASKVLLYLYFKKIFNNF